MARPYRTWRWMRAVALAESRALRELHRHQPRPQRHHHAPQARTVRHRLHPRSPTPACRTGRSGGTRATGRERGRAVNDYKAGPITPGWWHRAACRDADRDLFFAEGTPRREALDLCRACPVRVDCAHDAWNDESAIGLRGIAGLRAGLTEGQRRNLMREARHAQAFHLPGPGGRAACGTRSGYQRHIVSGEPACDPCKAAAAEYARRRRGAA